MKLRLVLFAAVLTGCASSTAIQSPDKNTVAAAAVCVDPSPRLHENPATMAALLSHVPDKAVVGMVVGPQSLSSGMPILDDPSVKEALEYIKRREGVDIAGFDGLVGYATSIDEKNPSVAVFVRVPMTRALKGTTAKTVAGVAIVTIEKGIVLPPLFRMASCSEQSPV